jgi:hypothetical protein
MAQAPYEKRLTEKTISYETYQHANQEKTMVRLDHIPWNHCGSILPWTIGLLNYGEALRGRICFHTPGKIWRPGAPE